jgi:ABC-type oligopeptide transport system substrate-binding subunit
VTARSGVWVVLVLGGLSCAAGAVELVVPTPVLPSVFDPARTQDVFSWMLMRQIHKPLFKLDSAGVPVPQAAESFQSTDGGRTLTVTLRPLRFHDGRPLRAADVKASLERAAAADAPGVKLPACLLGLPAFKDRAADHIAGIRVLGPRTVVFALGCPAPKLLWVLSDIRYSIVPEGRDWNYGLGDFKMASHDSSEVRLAAAAKTQGVTKVRFVKMSARQAIEQARRGTPTVIPQHSFTPTELAGLRAEADVVTAESFRTYVFALNSRTLPDAGARKGVLAALDRRRLVRTCYPGEETTNNLVPYGLPGHSPGLALPPLGPAALGAPLRVAVIEGIGSEDCVRRALGDGFSRAGTAAEVRILPINETIAAWEAGTIDALVAYVESDFSLEMLEFYTPRDSFNVGDASDVAGPALLNELVATPGVDEYARKAEALQRHLLARFTVLPLFNPKARFAFSRGLRGFGNSLVSLYYLEYSALTVSPR